MVQRGGVSILCGVLSTVCIKFSEKCSWKVRLEKGRQLRLEKSERINICGTENSILEYKNLQLSSKMSPNQLSSLKN